MDVTLNPNNGLTNSITTMGEMLAKPERANNEKNNHLYVSFTDHFWKKLIISGSRGPPPPL